MLFCLCALIVRVVGVNIGMHNIYHIVIFNVICEIKSITHTKPYNAKKSRCPSFQLKIKLVYNCNALIKLIYH
jgi:hypothetical protein